MYVSFQTARRDTRPAHFVERRESSAERAGRGQNPERDGRALDRIGRRRLGQLESPSPTVPQEVLGQLAATPGLELRREAPLARLTTFRIGGVAELLVGVRSEPALAVLCRLVSSRSVPLWLLGMGSNVLVPDAGLPGVTIRLAGELGRIRRRGELVSAGAAVPLARLARRLTAAGLIGLEDLAGFPSTVGGAVVMNAGCYGTEIAQRLVSVRVVDRAGRRQRLTVGELGAGYRTTRLQGSGQIVTRALLRLRRGDGAAALARIEELNRRRWQSLPAGVPNAGSVFRNPPGDYAGRLIDLCGLKGLRRGDAEISTRHANVVVNLGAARAADVLALMLEAYRQVMDRFDVRLEPELVLLGALGAEWRSQTAAGVRV